LPQIIISQLSPVLLQTALDLIPLAFEFFSRNHFSFLVFAFN